MGLRMAPPYWGEGNGTPLRYSCLENPVDGGAWKAAVHGVVEKAEEPEIKLLTSAGSWKKQESSRKTSISALLTMPILAWEIPWTEDPGGLHPWGCKGLETTE